LSSGEPNLHLRSWQLRGDPAGFVPGGDYPRSVNTVRLALAVKVTTYHSQTLRLNYVVFRDGTYTRGRRVGRVQATAVARQKHTERCSVEIFTAIRLCEPEIRQILKINSGRSQKWRNKKIMSLTPLRESTMHKKITASTPSAAVW
jgi:hypothetical protein